MKAFFTLRDKARAMLADGRSRQLIVAQLLADPCFGEFLAEHRLTQDLTLSPKVDLATTLLGFLTRRPRSRKESSPAGQTGDVSSRRKTEKNKKRSTAEEVQERTSRPSVLPLRQHVPSRSGRGTNHERNSVSGPFIAGGMQLALLRLALIFRALFDETPAKSPIDTNHSE